MICVCSYCMSADYIVIRREVKNAYWKRYGGRVHFGKESGEYCTYKKFVIFE